MAGVGREEGSRAGSGLRDGVNRLGAARICNDQFRKQTGSKRLNAEHDQ